jgi:hypothetical protein
MNNWHDLTQERLLRSSNSPTCSLWSPKGCYKFRSNNDNLRSQQTSVADRDSPAVFILSCSQVLDEKSDLVRIFPLLSPCHMISAYWNLYLGRGCWLLNLLPRVPFSLSSTPYLQRNRCHNNEKNVTNQQLRTFQYISIYCSLCLVCRWPVWDVCEIIIINAKPLVVTV